MPDIELTWTKQDNNPDGEWRIYRSADGSIGSEITGGLTPSTTSYTDTGRAEGTTYHYTLRRDTGDATADSTQVSVTTTLPAPTNNIVDAERDTELDQSWTLESVDEDGVRVYRRETGGSYTEVADLASGTETYTHTGLLNGEEYEVYAEAYTADAASASGTATGTTTLPDEDQPALGSGVEDEVAVDREAAVSNNGDVRIQIRETGESSWDSNATGFAEFIGAFDTLTMEFVGREDGEEYEVRARTETSHVTGAWTDPVAIVTKFPGASGLTANGISVTEIELTWSDNADNEDGQEVIRERRAPDGSWWPDQLLTDVGPNTESFIDDTIQPDREYRYRIRSYTEYAAATSSPDTATTSGLGLPSLHQSPQGWQARVDLGGPNPRRISVAAGAQWQGQLNDYPQVELPIAASDADVWRQRVGSGLRVRYDGTPLPIDEVADVETGASTTTLIGEGATQLRRRISAEESSRAAHLTTEDLITTHTDYVADVDNPASETVEDELFQEGDTTGELQDRLRSAIDTTDPFDVINDKIVAYNTGDVFEAEEYSEGTATFNAPGLSGSGVDDGDGAAARLSDVGDAVEKTITFDYDVPAGDAGIWVRQDDRFGTSVPTIEWFVDGQSIGTINIAGVGSWIDIADQLNFTEGLSAGDHTVRAEVSGTNGDDLNYDLIAVLDARFTYNFSNNLQDGPDGDRWLPGPETAPDAVDVVFEDVETPLSVVAARVEATLSGTSGSQQLAVSNDQGETYLTADNTDTLDKSFASAGGTLRLRVRLSRQGQRDSTTPLQGFEPQSLDSFQLYADVQDTPVLVNWSDEGDLADVITRICETADLVWEARPAPDADGTDTRIVVTRPGLRQSDADPDVVDFTDWVSVSNQTLACDVIGGRQSVSSERLTVSVGEWVSLGNADIITGTEALYDSGTGESFEAGTDYELRSQAGEIRALSGGDLVDGETYTIDYEFKPRGRYEDPGWDGDAATEKTERISELTTRRGCQQAALRIVQELRDQYVEVDAKWAQLVPTQSLAASVNLDRLPGDEAYRVNNLGGGVDGVTATLANRETEDETVANIRSSIQALSRRT